MSMTKQETQLLSQLFDNQREETNRRFDELGRMVSSRFDKLESALNAHVAEDSENFEMLKAEVVKSHTARAVKRRFWTIAASTITIVIAAVGVWVSYAN